MKKVVSLTFAIMFMTLVSVAQAEVKAGSASFTPFVGGYFFERNENLKDSAIFGLRAGYNFTENLSLEGFVSFLQTKMKDTPGEPLRNIYGCGAEGLYHFMPQGRFVPFIAIGVGGIHYGYPETYRENRFTVDYGAGMKIFITDDIALRADIRHVIPFNDRYNDLMCTLGINFSFGGQNKNLKDDDEISMEESYIPVVEKHSAPVVKEPSASVKAVPDNLNKCFDTPAGVPVDKDGCPLDSDRDGVPDYIDKCPGNPASIVVDKNGCPPDSDRDGIPDYLDKCLNTPAGINVDKKGCPPDSDSDGVTDSLDKCPDTPAGVKVDKDGCTVVAEQKVVEQKQDVPKIITIDTVAQFDAAKTVVNKKYYKDIKKVADYLKAHPETIAWVAGHTDNVEKKGDKIKNKKLSIARAESIRQYLIKKFRIDESRLTAVGFGSRKPVAGNATKEGRHKNRRVQVFIETVKK